MYRLGLANMNGELGLPINAKEAVKWFGRSVEAATPEYPEAVYKLANLYMTGVPNIIFVDHAYSVSLLNQAAEMGYPPAALKLGESYEYGKLNCQPDPALSIHYYTLAAEKGDRDACFALTAWYLVGSPDILPQSDEQAYIWAMRAAELGLAKAEYAIGYFSEKGIGCEKDKDVGMAWYQKAASHGDKRALDRLQMKETTSPESSIKQKKKDDCKIM
jgi:TPR repeat protein